MKLYECKPGTMVWIHPMPGSGDICQLGVVIGLTNSIKDAGERFDEQKKKPEYAIPLVQPSSGELARGIHHSRLEKYRG